MEVERELDQPAPEEIWQLTERLHVRLRELGEDAPYEIDYVFRDLYEPLIGGDVTKGEAMFTAVVVSTVLLSQLCASRPQLGENPNRASCRALARILTQDLYLPVCSTLLDMLRQERIDLNGNKVIVPVTNYLDEAESCKFLSASTRKAIDKEVDGVWEKTQRLNGLFTGGYTQDYYKNVWRRILAMPDMLLRIKEVSPHKNEWGMNMKMVANVVGMMIAANVLENNTQHVTDMIGVQKMRNYIRCHADYRPAGSSSVFTQEEHRMVMKVIKSNE